LKIEAQREKGENSQERGLELEGKKTDA